jgi:L-lactate dehydrogenase
MGIFMPKPKVFVVGAGGMVGATAAQALAIKEVIHDIVLIDVAADLVHGQAMDISHSTAFTDGVHVRTGDYSEIAKDDIIVITCGIAQKPGQSRLELLAINAKIIRDVVSKVMAQGKPVFILMVANPVDILTHVALKASGLPKERVFGTGTTLDTARLRVALAESLQVSQKEVQGYILGEHGDSSFPALSAATIGGVPLAQFPGFKPKMVENIDHEIRQSAYKIIETKKSTYYGIGLVVAEIVSAMLKTRASVFPICSLAQGEYGINDVVLGLPSLISSSGAKILDNYPLSGKEKSQLKTSAGILKIEADKVI